MTSNTEEKLKTEVTDDPVKIVITYINDISKRLAKQNILLGKIYGELVSEADEGEYFIIEKTATTTVDLLYLRDLIGHPVKSYTLKNDGLTNIQIGHNIDLSKRFSSVVPNGEVNFSFNRNKIRSIYIKSESGTPNYTLTLLW